VYIAGDFILSVQRCENLIS